MWRSDGRAIFYTSDDSLRVAELAFAPEPTVRSDRVLPSLSSSLKGCRCYSALPDGTGRLIVRRTFLSAPVTVVLNWFNDVKRRMAAAGQ